MDALRLLEQQHRELERLFGEYRQLSGPEKKELFAHLSGLLEAHVTLAEKLFYPEIMDEHTRAQLEESVALQLRMKRLLVELLHVRSEDSRFDVLFEALERDVARHIQMEEEEGLFQAVFDAHGRRALARLGEEMTTLDQLLRDGARVV